MEFIKIILIGDNAENKLAIIKQIMGNDIRFSTFLTIGAEFFVKKFVTNDKDIKLQFWVLNGKERFQSVRSFYYSKTHIVLLVLDVTQLESYQNILNGWLPELKKYIHGKNVPIILLGSNINLRDPNNPTHVTTEQGLKLVEEIEKEFGVTNSSVLYFEIDMKEPNKLYQVITHVVDELPSADIGE